MRGRSGSIFPVLLGGLMPWSCISSAFCARCDSPARAQADAAARRRRLAAAAVGVMPLLFFTLSIGKQPRYILPVLPPLAVVVARGMIDRIEINGDTPLVDRARRRGSRRRSTSCSPLMLVRMAPIFITRIPCATWVAVCLIGCAALALAGVAATSSWRLLPAVASVAGALVLVSVWFGALAGNRPGGRRTDGDAHSRQSRHRGRSACSTSSRGTSGSTPVRRALQLFDVKQASDFVQSPRRVLLVLRSTDVQAVEAASGMTLKMLGETRYLNSANVRLRTLLQPDPASGDRDDFAGVESLSA